MGETSAPLAPAQVREWIVLEVGNIRCGIAITQIQENQTSMIATTINNSSSEKPLAVFIR